MATEQKDVPNTTDPPEADLPTAEEERSSYAGFQVQKANTLAEQGDCFILYGPAGAGKTTLAASIVDSEHGFPAVMIEAEGGARSISHRENLDVITVRRWEDVRKFTQELKRDGNFPWKGVILDNLSEYADLAKRAIAGATDQPTQPEWGRITNELKDLVRTYRDFARDRGLIVVICAWDDEARDDVGKVKMNLAFTPAFRRELPGIVDIIGHIDVTNNPELRVLDFAPSPKSQSKFRRSGAENALSIPFKIPYSLERLPMPDILDVLKGGKKWPSDKYPQPRQRNNSSSDG